ncbi:hypothetical protein SDD30_11320 [Moorella naiadis]|uniref:hypothetical protein n=1 Tax=Moorella naiadis (nom. illeg.) TaxID=3093670 RepID=UPI003D9C8C53
MQWEDVKRAYPSQWVVIEAVEAHSKDNKRIIDKMAVIDSFMHGTKKVLRENARWHKLYPGREILIVHTSRPELDIEERRWAGVRLGV